MAGEFHEADLSDACNTTEIVADVVRTWLEKGENRQTLCYGVDRFVQEFELKSALGLAHRAKTILLFDVGRLNSRIASAVMQRQFGESAPRQGRFFYFIHGGASLVRRIANAGISRFGLERPFFLVGKSPVTF